MGEAARLVTSKAIGTAFVATLAVPALALSVFLSAAKAQGIATKPDPAHALAEKFSAEAERPAKEAAKREALRQAEEAEMLATAKAEAEARRAALDKARAAAELAERQAEDRKSAEIAAKAAEAKRVAEAKKAEDARKIAEARKAAEDKRIAEAKAAEEHRLADALLAEDLRRRQLEAQAEQAQAEARARAQAMAAEREAEAARVTERLRQAHARREQANSTMQTAAAPPRIEPPAGLGGPALGGPALGGPALGGPAPADIWATTTTPARAGSSRVTILLLMEPGNRGIRRHNKTADPLLCNGGGCFVSNGPDAAASFLPGRKALGAGRTFGERAGACSQSLGCVFRDVDLGSLPAMVQPIDMRVMHHDRRTAQTIDTPADCRATAGRLMCRRTIQGGDYTMWVVPEDVARTAGAAALENALGEGLPDSEHAAMHGGWRR